MPRLPWPAYACVVLPFVVLVLAAGGDPRLEARPPKADARVVDILPRRRGGALIVAAGAAYRLDLPAGRAPLRMKPAGRYDRLRIAAAPKRRTLTIDGCDLIPEPAGLRSKCLGGERLFRFGGFPVTAVAEYRGRLYVATYGGGLRTLDAPDDALAGFPAIIYALRPHGALLLAGTQEGLISFDGARAAPVPAT